MTASTDDLFDQIIQRLPPWEKFTLRRVSPHDWEARTEHGAVGLGNSRCEALAALRDTLDDDSRKEVRDSLAGTVTEMAPRQPKQPWETRVAA